MALRHALVDLTPLRTSPAFRRVWLGAMFSGFGGQMTLVAVMFQVWRATGSTVWTGAVGVAQAVPLIVVGLLAGSLVDRLDRRRIYLVALVGSAACSVLLAVQGIAGHTPTAVVLVLLAAQSCFFAVSGPAARTFVPRLLPPEQVAAGQALNRIAFLGAMLGGPALGGLVLGWLGVGGCYLVDVATFGLAFLGAFGLPAMRPEGTASRPGLHGLVDGLAFIARTPIVRGALITDLAATVLSMPVSLFPVVNAERFGGDPRTFGLFLSAIAVGGAVASALSGTFTRRARTGLVMLAGSAGWGIALVGFALTPGAWAALACLALAGAADTLTVVSRGTIVQLSTPDSMRGRLAAVEQMVGMAGPDLGNLRGGLVARATSATVALLTGGIACVAAVVLVGATTPGLRRAPAPPPAVPERASA